MDRNFAADYILANFEPSDRLAVVVVNRRTGAATQRISSAEHIASRDFQAWLHHRNAQGDDIYLSMNALKPEADRRTKENVGEIRHMYLDFDQDGEAAAARLIESFELPTPSQVVRTSQDKRHVIWRVEGFTKNDAEQLQKHLAHEWGADPAATDVSRVLRLPGFYNHKYGSRTAFAPKAEGPAAGPFIGAKIFQMFRSIGSRQRHSIPTSDGRRPPAHYPSPSGTGRLLNALFLVERVWTPSLRPSPTIVGMTSRTPTTMPLTRSERRPPHWLTKKSIVGLK